MALAQMSARIGLKARRQIALACFALSSVRFNTCDLLLGPLYPDSPRANLECCAAQFERWACAHASRAYLMPLVPTFTEA
jgi:hypothetical protein